MCCLGQAYPARKDSTLAGEVRAAELMWRGQQWMGTASCVLAPNMINSIPTDLGQ